MTCTSFRAPRLIFFAALLTLSACGAESYHTLTVLQATPLTANALSGDTAPVHDPSIIRQNATYYLFSSDPVTPQPHQYLPIRCSANAALWKPCGQVFTAMPAWVTAAVPGILTLWAPDISYFGGLYHVYFAASSPGSQASVIGLETNVTLNPSDPRYHWVDHGPVIASHPGDDFNAIDPNIFIDTNQRIWLTYGSYWSGIKQREIDPTNGMLLASNPNRYELAVRPGTPDDAIEGSSLIQHDGFYYLFLSVDHCCENSLSQDDYKQIVGRSSSPNGPFVDATGAALIDGGGSIVLESSTSWIAPGGGTAYTDPDSGAAMLVFHALNMSNKAAPTLWIKNITWQDDWPVLNQGRTPIAPE
jgi:arabinan endo-1,5-alpha-L-arabinosidase